ncbi:MAG: protein-L-isoaspartate O-methyltransferase family protein, partial [Geminicoccaceae bacterium]
LIGPDGHITAIECVPRFADAASGNLHHLKNVTVVQGDGCDDDQAAADVILVNAGVAAPASNWLDRLTIGGRLLMPLTNASRRGPVLLITRCERGFQADALTNIEIFSCEGARGKEASALLQVALWKEPATSIRSLRRDRHDATEHCWLHAGDFCLSKQAL